MIRLFTILSFLLLVIGCKKDTVDASSTRAFQSSINDMASRLSTLQQVKFSEALYILKTFGVPGDGDREELNNLARLLEGKKVQEIMALADQVAAKNEIAWKSTAPPSLGEMNIFGSLEAKETDNNDIKAAGLLIKTVSVQKDSILGPKALQIVPRLVDNNGSEIEFSGAALETVLEITSNGSKVYTAKNLMVNNDFPGFRVRMASFTAAKIPDGKVDITVMVKTSKKTYKMSKIGVPVNMKAFTVPVEPAAVAEADDQGAQSDASPAADETDLPSSSTDPKLKVTEFLNQLSTQNLRGAYSNANNPVWGSFESFSNPTTGFGSIKNINVKNITTASSSEGSAAVDATYDITDQSGKVTALNVSFGLKNVNGEWKIASYKIK